MKKGLGVILFILLFGVIGACSKDEPVAKQPAANENAGGNSVSGNEESSEIVGNEVFQQSCITCHSSGDLVGGQAKLDAVKVHADFSSEEELLAFVSKNMPKSAPGSLTKEEYEAVVKYLWDQK
jgi:mono/diheme cytochrome c family protein